MVRFARRPLITVGTAGAASALLVVAAAGAALAQPATGSSGTSGTERVIVLLGDQNASTRAGTPARQAAVASEQAPVIAQLRSSGAQDITSVSLINAVVAKVTPAEAAAVAKQAGVQSVVPDSTIPGPAPVTPAEPTAGATGQALTAPCGTPTNPELDPEALSAIHATPSELAGNYGQGVTVAYIADGVDPGNPDFVRNAAYASPGSPTGSAVVTQYDFSGDPASVPTPGGEAFLDSSSIAAQGNTTYDLSQYVSPTHPLPSPCDIQIVGAAPGANVMALKVFGEQNETTSSAFVEAINFAVSSGVKVINESFGANNFPDTSQDLVRAADDAAVQAGVTVVSSSGDAGVTSTLGSPSTDPAVISAGASTTFRSYQQATFGGINAPVYNGRVVDNNISSLSSGGYSQSGNTVDLVAPGDLNWALCSTDVTLFTDCQNVFNGLPAPVQQSGGTSESSPLTAAAAADVIAAYAATHGGNDPAPALVKQILTSTTDDIDAPAVEQGSGLLDVQAAVAEARSLPGTSDLAPAGGLLISPNQINIEQNPHATTSQQITVTNTGSEPVTVRLSGRALTDKVGVDSGSFCMQPGTPTSKCPANTGAFPIWSGITEVYQEVPFTVSKTKGTSRLVFSADYPYTGQTSLLHFALFEPDGTYAAYSLPQGLGDFGEVEVANPPPGKWTAVFFTEQDGATPGGLGTSGKIQWSAQTWQYASAGRLSASTLALGPGASASVKFSVTSPATSGDSDLSVVLASPYGTTTVPVTIRTNVPTSTSGGSFSGVVTGGNGRNAPAQTSSYVFNVPGGKRDLDVAVTLSNDPNDIVDSFLVSPTGQTLGYTSNVSTDASLNPIETRFLDSYVVNPSAGQWELVLDWFNPVSGSELSEPFSGAIKFNGVDVSSTIPSGHVTLAQGKTASYIITVHNTGKAPEAYFADPRLDQTQNLTLLDQNGAVSDTDMTLPLPSGPNPPFPYYFVPPDSSQLTGSITGSAPVTFDTEFFPGDPDVSPLAATPSTTGGEGTDSATVTLSEPAITPGTWLLNPAEIGPYPASGAPPVTASASLSVVTAEFDPDVATSTGNFWSTVNGLTSSFSPNYAASGGATKIAVQITPTAAVGQTVTGVIYVEDYALGALAGVADPDAEQLAAIPYSYTVGS